MSDRPVHPHAAKLHAAAHEAGSGPGPEMDALAEHTLASLAEGLCPVCAGPLQPSVNWQRCAPCRALWDEGGFALLEPRP